MLRNYIKIAFRNFKRYKVYSAINIIGLALGISCGILIFSLVRYHLSFDNFHIHADRIYRFVTEQHRDDITYRSSTPSLLGKVFREDYTYGETVARICTWERVVSFEEKGTSKRFKEEAAFTEPEFFDIFNYPLLKGNVNSLSEPHSAIITASLAKKYFGNEDPMGKAFTFDNRIDFKITGILKDFPDNTDRKTLLYLSYSNLKDFEPWYDSEDSWGGINGSYQSFVRLKPGVAPVTVENVLSAYVKKFRPTNKNVHQYKLQPLSDIHFNAQYGGMMEKRNLWILSLIGFFLLGTACVNFINLATAQAVNRSREVGVRKVLGGVHRQLFWQFILETGLITSVATLLALVIAYTALPFLNQIFKINISIALLSDWRLLFFIPTLIVSVTFLSGSYPGLILAGFQPVLALKGKLSQRHAGGFNIRRSLIVIQFTLSQVLLVGLIVIAWQIHYARQSDLGFTKDAIVMIPVASYDAKLTTLKNQLHQIGGVEKVSVCYSAPASRNSWRTSLRYSNRAEVEAFGIKYRGADDQYLDAFDLKLVAGRNLTPSDTVKEFLVNETLVKKLNLKSPEDILGTMLSVNGGAWNGPVVGVLKDFHDESFHEDIDAVYITSNLVDYGYYAVKINKADVKGTLAALEKTWTNMYPDKIYEYEFLDDQIAEFYITEETMMKLIQVFSFIAILVGCMGLYGLVSFMAIQKTKEIGIRKVLGGSPVQMLWIFGKEFSVLILVAFILATPISWWLMTGWLQNFKYHIAINVWVFLLAIGITGFVAIITVSHQSLKAALVNPVSSLRSE